MHTNTQEILKRLLSFRLPEEGSGAGSLPAADAEVTWDSLMYRHLMPIEWKVWTDSHLSCVSIDRSVNIGRKTSKDGGKWGVYL